MNIAVIGLLCAFLIELYAIIIQIHVGVPICQEIHRKALFFVCLMQLAVVIVFVSVVSVCSLAGISKIDALSIGIRAIQECGGKSPVKGDVYKVSSKGNFYVISGKSSEGEELCVWIRRNPFCIMTYGNDAR